MSGFAGGPVLLIGGTSEIGLAIVRRLVATGPVEPHLLGRDGAALEAALGRLHSAGCAGGSIAVLDADDLDAHPAAVRAAFERAGGFQLVVLAVGRLGAQAGLDAGRASALEVMRVNFVGTGSLLFEALRALRDQRSGTLVVLSSVAVERARSGNAIYGAAKAGLDALAQGLADTVAGEGIRVLVVRPGFVRTKMTTGLPAAPFTTSADHVADATVHALGTSVHTVWVPGFLRYVFFVLRHLPRGLYRRLPL